MRKEITYYAFDDTEFDTEEKCLEYERNVKLRYEAVLLLDEHLRPIDMSSKRGLDDLEDAINESYYIKILDAKTAEKLFYWIRISVDMNMDGFPDEFSDGMWLAYDDDNGVWFDPVACMKHYADIVDKLNEVSGCR